MAFKWLKSRQTKYTGYAALYTLVIIGVLAAANFLANRYEKSYDSTANKQYSLSDQTVKLVKGLKYDLTITYFGGSETFPAARDLVGQYADLSTKIHAVYIDPVRKPQQAKSAGYRSDAAAIVSRGPKQEAAKSLSEEELTGALMRAEKTGDRTVYFLSASGEHSIDDTAETGYSVVKQLEERDNYKTQTLTLKGVAPEAGKQVAIGQAAAPAAFEVPKDCTVLVIAGPRTDYPAVVVNGIRSYVEGGGRALIMLDGALRIGRGEPAAENLELLKVLEDWGVTVNNDLVLDLTGLGQIFGLGPEIPLIADYGQHPITAPLAGLPTAFPMTRSIDVKPNAKANVTKLAETNVDSVATTSIAANGQVDTAKGKKGPLTLAVAGTLSGTKQGRFIVVGDSTWAEGSLVSSRRIANRDLFGNMINWLSSDEDLISIRPKGPEDRPLNLAGTRLNMLFWLSVVIFPLAIVALGVGAWWKRR